MKNNYLYSEAKRILADMGYDYHDFDINYLVNDFDERYTPDFEPYSVWYDVIEDYVNCP